MPHRMPASPTSTTAEDSAIDWMVELRAGDVTPDTRQAFQRWLDARPEHRQAWQRLGGALEYAFGDLPQAPRQAGLDAATVEVTLRQAEQHRHQRRRLLRNALILAGTGIGLGWLAPRTALHLGLAPDLLADLHTGTGERRSYTLPDGSLLTLDARSSVDLIFDATLRLVRLRQGQLIVSVQPGQAAPFIVETTQGQAQALGTRYLVRQESSLTRVDVLEHRVAVRLRDREASQILEAGQGILMRAQTFERLPEAGTQQPDAWLHGRFIAHDRPLSDVIDALRPYHRGLLRISPQAAALRVTGNYSLDHPRATLTALAETLPLHIKTYASDWIIQIDTKLS